MLYFLLLIFFLFSLTRSVDSVTHLLTSGQRYYQPHLPLGPLLDRLSASPHYTFLVLNFLNTLSQFIIVSQDQKLRIFADARELWAVGNNVPGAINPHGNEGHSSAVRQIFESLAASVEQLTGAPVAPLVRAVADWWSVADDKITDFAAELSAFLSTPVRTPGNKSFRYVRHPLLGIPFSPEETIIRARVIADKWRLTILEEPHRSALIRVLKGLDRVVGGIQGNSVWSRWSRSAHRLLAELTDGRAGIEEWAEALRITLSGLVHVPLDDIKM
jgi:hypothetical protein